MTRRLFIDGDSIAYAAGAAPSIAECHRAVDTVLNKTLEGCGVSAALTEGYIEEWRRPKSLHRKHVAVSRPYKGNRTQEPPAFVDNARLYMVETWGFRPVCHYESEEVCIFRAEKHPGGIIAGIDKDLLQYPGLHYNYRHHVLSEVSELKARLFFHKQILTGDPTDNIQGCPGIGDLRAEAILGGLTALPELEAAVAATYKAKGLSWHYLMEQARLLYLLRHPADVFRFTTLTAEDLA